MIELHPHQYDAYDHILSKEKDGPLRGGILCLKMGLGKTRVILHLIQTEKNQESKEKTLIAC